MSADEEREQGYYEAQASTIGLFDVPVAKALQAYLGSTSDLQRITFAREWIARMGYALPETFKAIYELGSVVRTEQLWQQPDPKGRIFSSFEEFWEAYFGGTFRLLLQLESTYQLLPKDLRVSMNEQALSPSQFLTTAQKLFSDLEAQKKAVVATEEKLKKLFGITVAPEANSAAPPTELPKPPPPTVVVPVTSFATQVIPTVPANNLPPPPLPTIISVTSEKQKKARTQGIGKVAEELLRANPNISPSDLGKALYGEATASSYRLAYTARWRFVKAGRMKKTDAGFVWTDTPESVLDVTESATGT